MKNCAQHIRRAGGGSEWLFEESPVRGSGRKWFSQGSTRHPCSPRRSSNRFQTSNSRKEQQ
jgi:hypothetical protein